MDFTKSESSKQGGCVGNELGCWVGCSLGCSVGWIDGCSVGWWDGSMQTSVFERGSNFRSDTYWNLALKWETESSKHGGCVGIKLGCWIGCWVGCSDGWIVGCCVGCSDGAMQTNNFVIVVYWFQFHFSLVWKKCVLGIGSAVCHEFQINQKPGLGKPISCGSAKYSQVFKARFRNKPSVRSHSLRLFQNLMKVKIKKFVVGSSVGRGISESFNRT